MISYNPNNFRKEGITGKIVLFNKKEEKYEFITEINNTLSQEITELLTMTKASDKESRILFCKNNKSFQAICAIGIKKDDVFSIRKAGAVAYKSFDSLKCKEIIVPVNYNPKLLIEGALLASFDYDFLKKEKKEFVKLIPEKESNEFVEGYKIASTQNFARFLGESPANHMTPTLFTNHIKEYLKERNILIKEYDKKFAEENKMGLFLSVAQGSNEPLKFLHLQYKGSKKEETDVALVGKGITFDSGGISLKPSAKMEDMKLDMMGAASVCSDMALISDLKLEINVDCFVPLTENLPSGTATKPGDVFIGMNGISVEVENTDAEGRLVLADAMTYAQKFNPTYLIDVATLTGAIVVALGSVYTGLFSNNDDFSKLILNSGEKTGDLCWRMPLDERFKSGLESIDSDIKNSGDRKGGSCSAAAFLKEFVGNDVKWAHLDIAGSMNGSYFSELYGKGATGIPVNLLYEVIKKISENK